MNRGVAWPWHQARRRAKSELLRRLYIDRSRSPADSVLVLGTARSGTSWLADTLAAATGARVVFEPFNTETVSESRVFGEFPYRRKEDDDERLAAFCHKVLTGRLRGPWVDRSISSLFPHGRIIKAVRANLLVAWLRRNFPAVPLVLVLRHPCAVALSRTECGWPPEPDIAALLAQSRFVEEELGDVLHVVTGARSTAARHAVIWGAHNRTALRQHAEAEVIVTCYEHLCLEPEMELRRILDAINAEWTPRVMREALRPSGTSRITSAVITGEDKVRRWQTAMAREDVESVLEVVRQFGLAHVYDESAMPANTALRSIRVNDGNGLLS